MDRSVVVKKKRGDLGVVLIQQQIKEFGVEVKVLPVGETYCYLSFA